MLPHELVLRWRELFVLQNTIHWIKSISIEDKSGQDPITRAFQADQLEAYLHDCHEYVFQFTLDGQS